MSMYDKNPLQYCGVVSLQLTKINEKKQKESIGHKPAFFSHHMLRFCLCQPLKILQMPTKEARMILLEIRG